MGKKLKLKTHHGEFPKAACLQKFVTCARVLRVGKLLSAKCACTRCTVAHIIARDDQCIAFDHCQKESMTVYQHFLLYHDVVAWDFLMFSV